MNSIHIYIFAIYLVVNLYPTIKTVKTTGHTNKHKLYLLLAIWFISFLGGLTFSLIFMINPAYGGRSYDVGLEDSDDGGGGGE